jgi:hypothetical protein
MGGLPEMGSWMLVSLFRAWILDMVVWESQDWKRRADGWIMPPDDEMTSGRRHEVHIAPGYMKRMRGVRDVYIYCTGFQSFFEKNIIFLLPFL